MAKQTRDATKGEASGLATLYGRGLDLERTIQAAQRGYIHDLVTNPDAEPPTLDEAYAELRTVRQALEELPSGTRAKGASRDDVVGALYGTKTKQECRRVCREAFGR